MPDHLQIIPAVDVLGGRVVRLLRGEYGEATEYGDDPVARSAAWQDEGADLVHVVDLEGARTGHPDPGLWTRLATAGVRFQVGGGIRDAATAATALRSGASRVVLGTAAVWNPSVLEEIGDPARVVAAVDVRDGKATGSGWTEDGRDLGSVLDDLSARGVERLLVTGITRDGTMEGPELELLDTARRAGRFRIIASGGVGDLEDLRGIRATGCEAVVVGRALYERRFTLAEAIAVGRER